MKAGAPGVFQPACPGCKQTFVLVIPKERGQGVIVAKSLEKLRAKAGKTVAGQVVALPGDAPPATGARPGAGALAGVAAPSGGDTGAQAPSAGAGEMPTLAGDAAEAATLAGDPSEAPTMAGGATPGFSAPAHAATRSADDDASDQPLGTLDGYELIQELGRGGMGCVYLARQVSLDRRVAVKTIHPNVADDPVFLARFVREAFAVAQLSHHNVVQIHDVGQDQATHFFSMELVPGRSLADVVKQNGPLDPRAAATYILHAARGLAFAHEHRMVHRDVKPANLLLSDTGLVKVADLGLVKTDKALDAAAARSGALSGAMSGSGSMHGASAGSAASRSDAASMASTRAKTMLGTPAYMAPEQALFFFNV